MPHMLGVLLIAQAIVVRRMMYGTSALFRGFLFLEFSEVRYNIGMRERIDSKLMIAIKAGSIGVLPTDTLYGLVASALDRRAIERVYRVRRRNPQKPAIILVGSLADLKRFGVYPTVRTLALLKRLWPGPVSVVLPCPLKKFTYLHRGTKKLAFRLPRPFWLRRLVKRTGPLIAPSANPEGKPPAATIHEARAYFKNAVDFYVDHGRLCRAPSSVIQVLR